MKVTLARNWNAPGDHLFFARNNPNEVDEDLLPYLPSDSILHNSDGKALTRDETRIKVLKERRRLNLDKPTNELPATRKASDEELLAIIDGKDKLAEVPGTTRAPDAPPKKVDVKELEKNLDAAKQRLASQTKVLENAKTEAAKGEAKVEIEKAKDDIAKLEALIEEAE